MTTVIMHNPVAPFDVPTAIIPPPDVSESVIKNTFFFPDVDPKRVRELMRLEHTVTPQRLRRAIQSGIAETNAELYLYREQQIRPLDLRA